MRCRLTVASCRLPWSAVLILVPACGQPRTSPAPAQAAAPFVAASPNNGQTPPRNECWLAGRFEGVAHLRDGELELVMPRGWIAVTRDNDKQWDDLHLVVEVNAHAPSDARWPPITTSIPMVLRPTVDSAGPQLTTWQSADTLRLLVPYKQALGPRWLLFYLDYRTLSHAGASAECAGRLITDTLRFGGRGP